MTYVPPTSASTPNPASSAHATSTPADWVKGTSKQGNMSIMTTEKRFVIFPKSHLTYREQLKSIPRPTKPKAPTVSSSSDGRVVIDGVVFQFEQDGKKLTRIGGALSISSTAFWTLWTDDRSTQSQLRHPSTSELRRTEVSTNS